MQAARYTISVAHSQAFAMAAAVVAMVLLAGGLPHWTLGSGATGALYLAP